MLAEVRDYRSRLAPTPSARQDYIHNWHVLKNTSEDSPNFSKSWDEILWLEGIFEFSIDDFKLMRKRAHLRVVGAQKG